MTMTRMTMALFLVMIVTSTIVVAAPSLVDVLDEEARNYETDLAVNEQTNVAKFEVDPEVQEEAIGPELQANCKRVCIRKSRFGLCILWRHKCQNSRSFEEASVNVLGSNIEDKLYGSHLDQKRAMNVDEQLEVEPEVQEEAIGPEAQANCERVCIRKSRFGLCILWRYKCKNSRSFEEASLNALGSNTEDKQYGSQVEQERAINVDEQLEVEPVVQEEAIGPEAQANCERVCIRKSRVGLCILWRHKCKNSRSFEEASLNGLE